MRPGTSAPDAARCRLYLVTPPAFAPAPFAEALAAALDGGDVACVELRLRDAGDDEVRRAADALIRLLQARDTAFLLCDRVDLAAGLGCDGVCLRAPGGDVAEARRLLGAAAIVGSFAGGSRHLAMVAGEAGADFIGFGPVFGEGAVGLDGVRWWSELMVEPSVAWGGLILTNIGEAVAAGADFVAVSRAVWDHPKGPRRAIAELNGAVDSPQASC